MRIWDFACGNPAYQIENDNNDRKEPVYHYFMEAAYQISNCAELITPGRFLFDAGQTPKAWNQKMLNSEHLKVLHYEPDGSVIFPNTDIKGGGSNYVL
ncbi:MAG: Eco57I restriction-modification methylase domain-containing protein [Flexilinea sp.]|nr:Eco57I restriction-modification methylase domain-containing protein [Flexilinea sp.]